MKAYSENRAKHKPGLETPGRIELIRQFRIAILLVLAQGCLPPFPATRPENLLAVLQGESATSSSAAPVPGTPTTAPAPLTSWDTATRPRITTWNASSYTVSWTALSNAVNYKIYYWTSNWNFDQNTAANSLVLFTNINSARKVCAVDSSATEFECLVVNPAWRSSYPDLPSREISGSFSDDFNDGSLASSFAQFNPAQLVEASGYLQLNQNITDNGPTVALYYNRGTKRYLRIAWKHFAHRNNTYFSGGINLTDATGIDDRLLVSMAYKDDWPCYGFCNSRWTCSDTDAYASCSGYSGSTIAATQIFDAWMDMEVIMDFSTGEIIRKLNGTPYAAFTLRSDWGQILGINFTPSGWWTGHYIRIDDLSIQSQDAPFP